MAEEPGRRSPLQAEERHQAILDRVRTEGSVTVRELAESLGVAAVTVRVDVRELARRGLIRRTHGGATRVDSPDPSASPGADQTFTPAPLLPAQTEGTAGAPRRLRTLGVVVPHASYYYPSVVAGARTAAEALGARLVLGVSQNDVAEEQALVARLLESGVDGLVVATRLDPQRSPETEAWLRAIPVPVVLAERRTGWDCGDVEHVATDHEQGAFDAVAHLARLGRTRIGLLQYETLTAHRLRTGYDAALATLGLTNPAAALPQELVDETPRQLQEKAEAISRAVRAEELDALVVHNDVAALPLVSHLRQSGIGIPQDLAVVCYDDELAALSDPPLTAVAPPRAAVGSTAVTLLAQRLDEPTRPQHHLLLRPQLRVRGSCGALAETREPALARGTA